MGMTIDDVVLELRWLQKINKTILETDAKEIDADSAWIKHWESVTQALDIAIDTARKYQMVRADYEARLKADLEAILVELQLEIEESENCGKAFHLGLQMASNIIQQKINELKQESTTKTDKVDCKHTDCNNCVNHKYCDYEPTTKNDLGVDAVSRQAVLDLIADYDLSMGQVVKGIHALPPVTPQEPKKGHWIIPKGDVKPFGDDTIQCDMCGFFTDVDCNYNFCPNCGAKMVEPQESEVEDGNDD